MSARPEFEVEDNPWTWLAVYAAAYTATDRLHRQLTRTIAGRSDGPARRGAENHLQEVAHQRRQAYSSLVAAAMECEALRLKTEATSE